MFSGSKRDHVPFISQLIDTILIRRVRELFFARILNICYFFPRCDFTAIARSDESLRKLWTCAIRFGESRNDTDKSTDARWNIKLYPVYDRIGIANIRRVASKSSRNSSLFIHSWNENYTRSETLSGIFFGNWGRSITAKHTFESRIEIDVSSAINSLSWR